MKITETIAETKAYTEEQKSSGKSIGFVPTMGALHEGHLSLVRRSRLENEITVVSIFVNPIQFNNPEDLKKYPRTLEEDALLLEKEGVDVIFAPTVSEMYPEQVNTVYDFGSLGTVMEGAFRPGHFNGVAVVVHKLFDIVSPDRAYFGEKDYQQLMIIKSLVKNYKIPVDIVACPISRENDGLARSSRNMRLSTEMRAAAPFIYAQLVQAKKNAPYKTAGEIEQDIKESFRNNGLLDLEYFTIADGETLEPVTGKITPNAYGYIAAFAGDIRLIDNIRLI